MLFAQIPRTHDEYKRMKRMNVVHENLQDVQYASMDEEVDVVVTCGVVDCAKCT